MQTIKVCYGGNMHGCNNLGVLYKGGESVKQDDVKAASLYKKACDGG